MNRHPGVGRGDAGGNRTALGKRPVFQTTAQIAIGHDERRDGGCYPNGLAGEESELRRIAAQLHAEVNPPR